MVIIIFALECFPYLNYAQFKSHNALKRMISSPFRDTLTKRTKGPSKNNDCHLAFLGLSSRFLHCAARRREESPFIYWAACGKSSLAAKIPPNQVMTVLFTWSQHACTKCKCRKRQNRNNRLDFTCPAILARFCHIPIFQNHIDVALGMFRVQ